MAISFPSSPTTGQSFSVGNITWVYNGTSWDAATLGSGQMNYVLGTNTQINSLGSSPNNIASVTITTNGYPVLVSCGGDANPLAPGNWCIMRLYRGATAIGNPVQTEGSAANENNPYTVDTIDIPPAGTYTYYLKMTANAGNFQFGEGGAPTMYAIELAGAITPSTKSSGYVNPGVFVQLDNIKATLTSSGQRGLSVAAVSGSFSAIVGANYALSGGANGSSTNGPISVTTTPSGSYFGWSFPGQGDISTYILTDITNFKTYRITLQIGGGYVNNFISIERLS